MNKDSPKGAGFKRFSEIRRPSTPDRRVRVDAIARRMETAEWLHALRAAAGVTQSDVAEKLGVTQGRVSQIESRDDVALSTLRDYVEAIGGELDVAVTVNGQRIPLEVRPGD